MLTPTPNLPINVKILLNRSFNFVAVLSSLDLIADFVLNNLCIKPFCDDVVECLSLPGLQHRNATSSSGWGAVPRVIRPYWPPR